MPEELLNLDPDSCVSASTLVRGFGAWQERAMAQPVFVMRRGRPSLVLTSFDLMRRLCINDGVGGAAEAHQALLLDSMREAVIAIDTSGRIESTNRAARLIFASGEAAARDVPLARLMPPAVAQFLVDHAARARRSGATEHAEVAIGDRHLAIVVAPHAAGALLIFDDRTLDARAETLGGSHAALAEAVAAIGGVAVVRINLRGYVEPSSSSLATLAGLAEPVLASVRFVTLLDIGSRVAAGEAIEATVREGIACRLVARLTRNNGEALPVHIAFAPERNRLTIDAVTALIVADAAPRENAAPCENAAPRQNPTPRGNAAPPRKPAARETG